MFPSHDQLGLAKAKKWISNIYNIHDDELDMACSAHDDLGEAVYYLDSSAGTKEEITLQSVLGLLSMDCSGIDSNSFNIIRHAFLNMGALEMQMVYSILVENTEEWN